MNAIVAGFLTGGILAFRGGAAVAFKNACVGGAILGVIELVSICMMQYQTRQQYQMMHQQQEMMTKMSPQDQMAFIEAMQRGE